MGASSYLRLTRMGLTALRVAYAGRGVGIIVIVRVRGGARVLGVGVGRRRVCGVVVVRVALGLVGHDSRYACVTVVSCVTARLNEGIG